MYTELSYDVDGHVGVITLRRPEARNALTFTTYHELEDAVRNAAVRCLIITGADPAFCSGDDVKQIMAGGEGARPAVTNLAPRLTPAADAAAYRHSHHCGSEWPRYRMGNGAVADGRYTSGVGEGALR
jgi:enoyl-CoA hydratase/carnithine racemase